MTLTPNHLTNVCLLHSQNIAKTCRYLMNDELEPNKWYCLKLMPEDKADIDRLVSAKKKAGRLKTKPIPSGDNCSGYPLLKHIPQGYDAD